MLGVFPQSLLKYLPKALSEQELGPPHMLGNMLVASSSQLVSLTPLFHLSVDSRSSMFSNQLCLCWSEGTDALHFTPFGQNMSSKIKLIPRWTKARAPGHFFSIPLMTADWTSMVFLFYLQSQMGSLCVQGQTAAGIIT